MNLPRRTFLQIAAGAAVLPAMASIAQAQTYPTRSVHLLVGFAAGGPSDIGARLIGQALSGRLGQPFVIENRPGAATNLATEEVVRATPDGYTLLEINTANAVNVSLYDNLSFNFMRDIAPVASTVRGGAVMVVNPSVPAKTIPEFIAYAKANPGKLNLGSGGLGGPAYLRGELFKAMTGIDLVHVPYRGVEPALVALLGGQVQVVFAAAPGLIDYIRSGKLRPLGVTSATRMKILPDVPPIGDFVPGYEVSTWDGIGAPANTPPEIIAILNKQVNAVLADATFRERLADLGLEPFASSPADFAKLIAEDTEKWGKVVRAAGIKTD